MKFASSLLLLIGFSISVSAEVRGKEGSVSSVVEEGKRNLEPLGKNDPNFRYYFENKKGKMSDLGSCGFVEKMPKKRCKVRINGKKVADSCPQTCKKFIQKKINIKKMMMMKKKSGDDKNFVYIYENKNGEEVVKEDGCEFVAKKPESRCSKTVNGDEVFDKCAKTCKDHKFSLEGTRMYLGCSSELFEMTIACGIFGDDDPDLCLITTVQAGAVVMGEDGENVIETRPAYGQDIEDIDDTVTCVASGVFSMDRIVGNVMEPIPMATSAGCSIQNVEHDYQYVMKGLIDRKKDSIKLHFSSDYGFTYYTDEVDTPKVYTAVKSEIELLDDRDQDDRRLKGPILPLSGLPYFASLASEPITILGCRGGHSTTAPVVTRSPASSPVVFRSPATVVPRDFVFDRALVEDDAASPPKEQTQHVII